MQENAGPVFWTGDESFRESPGTPGHSPEICDCPKKSQMVGCFVKHHLSLHACLSRFLIVSHLFFDFPFLSFILSFSHSLLLSSVSWERTMHSSLLFAKPSGSQDSQHTAYLLTGRKYILNLFLNQDITLLKKRKFPYFSLGLLANWLIAGHCDHYYCLVWGLLHYEIKSERFQQKRFSPVHLPEQFIHTHWHRFLPRTSAPLRC